MSVFGVFFWVGSTSATQKGQPPSTLSLISSSLITSSDVFTVIIKQCSYNCSDYIYVEANFLDGRTGYGALAKRKKESLKSTFGLGGSRLRGLREPLMLKSIRYFREKTELRVLERGCYLTFGDACPFKKGL